MNKNYSPQDFFACVPKVFLKQYFDNHHVMQDVDFQSTDNDLNQKILVSWSVLDEAQRNEMETHFQEIHALANEKGMNALIDEALFCGEALNNTFEENELVGFEARAFWSFLNRESLWKNALSLNYADNLIHWKKRSELGDYPAKVDEPTIQSFTKALADYFGNGLYMGKNCQVDCLKRVVDEKNYDYFFAYPEDFARVIRDWDGESAKKINPKVHRKALEVIFLYCREQQELEIWCQFPSRVVKDLQKIFAKEILGIELTKPVKVKKEYELDAFKQSMPNLIFAPQTGIESIRVNKLRITMSHSKDKITLEANTHDDPQAVYKLFEKLKNSVSGDVMNITQVGLVAQFVLAENGKPQTRKFSMSYPDSCSLKHTGKDAILRQMLIDSGIQPKPVTKVADKQ